jgi:hypothetical protein
MRSCRLPVAAFAVFAASVASAAEQNGAVGSRVIGVPDSLRALAEQAAASASAVPNADAVLRSGYVDINVAGAIKSNVPPAASRKLFCYIYFGTQYGAYTSRSVVIPAVISGNTYSCTGKIYYKWTVMPTDRLVGNGAVFGADTAIGEVLFLTSTSGGVTFAFTPTASFPANGAVTKLTATGVNF